MNTIIDDENTNHLRYAEYVLGVLDADMRAEVAREVEMSSEAATAVALWQHRLVPLADSIANVAPADYVWARIHHALQLDAPTRVKPQSAGLWNNLPLWHWLGLGASAVAVALLVVVSLPRTVQTPTQAQVPTTPVTAPAATSAGFMAATIQQDNGSTGWTATMDPRQGRMIVVPATPVAFASDRAPELWLIPAGGKPIPVAMIAHDKATTIALDPKLVAELGPTALLAVSVEPIGGSPTGQPTGAVVAKGGISTSADAGALSAPGKVTLNGNGQAHRGSV